jgi:hypothetical protein
MFLFENIKMLFLLCFDNHKKEKEIEMKIIKKKKKRFKLKLSTIFEE